MTAIDEQEELVETYLKLDQAKQKLEKDFEEIKQKLVDFSRSNKRKTLRSGKITLTVMVKERTVFPKLNQPGRKEVEKILKNSGDYNNILSFDVVKLAEAYDNKTLPDSVREELKSYLKTENLVKIFLNRP